MNSLQRLAVAMDAAEDRKAIAKMPTRQAIDTVAAWNGWELLRDEGYFVQFGRGEERLTVRFSDDDAERGRRLTSVYNQYPTGDRTALDGRVCFAARNLDNRDKGKREAALAWLADKHFAKPGTNEILARFGYEPVLPEAGADAAPQPVRRLRVLRALPVPHGPGMRERVDDTGLPVDDVEPHDDDRDYQLSLLHGEDV